MNVNDNHLVELSEDQSELMDDFKDYTPVPEELRHASALALGDRKETYISKHSGGKLSKWAASERKKKRKAQKLARKQNR